MDELNENQRQAEVSKGDTPSWEDEARAALESAVEGLTFDYDSKTVSIHDDIPGPNEFKIVEGLINALADVYESAWDNSGPWDDGPVFPCGYNRAEQAAIDALQKRKEELNRLGWEI
jgi:hypothetical protein